MKNEHNINAPQSKNFAYFVLKVPYQQFWVHFECQIAYDIGLNFVIV